MYACTTSCSGVPFIGFFANSIILLWYAPKAFDQSGVVIFSLNITDISSGLKYLATVFDISASDSHSLGLLVSFWNFFPYFPPISSIISIAFSALVLPFNAFASLSVSSILRSSILKPYSDCIELSVSFLGVHHLAFLISWSLFFIGIASCGISRGITSSVVPFLVSSHLFSTFAVFSTIPPCF
jgi:hypothetical protein